MLLSVIHRCEFHFSVVEGIVVQNTHKTQTEKESLNFFPPLKTSWLRKLFSSNTDLENVYV